jgi:uncharacterized protein
MRIAIIGAGIAGLTAAHRLVRDHEITVFEIGDRVGGHTRTVQVDTESGPMPVDMGFIVFNDRTYPNFRRLIDGLGVETMPSDMGFAVRCDRTGVEYAMDGVSSIFAQRRNLFRPGFWRMLLDIRRFSRESAALLEEEPPSTSLGDFLEAGGYSTEFVNHFLIPMGGAIWSSGTETMRRFPASFFVRFFTNHGFLTPGDRPTWRVIRGGSSAYLGPLSAPFADRIRLNAPIRSIDRRPEGVFIDTPDGGRERFDRIILATHSDQALSLLGEGATSLEREILGAIPYEDNDVVLHRDVSVLARRKRARSSWNALIPTRDEPRATLTYDMNRLQRLRTRTPLLVTLNQSATIRPDLVIRRERFAHPVYTLAGHRAQARHAEIDGMNRTHFVGAYWRYGFHEDGVASALRVARKLEARP